MSLLPIASYNNYNYNYSSSPVSTSFRQGNQIINPPYQTTYPDWNLKTRQDDEVKQPSYFKREAFETKPPSTLSTATEDPFEDSNVVNAIVTFLGISGIIVPFFTIATIPLQLLNPNLLIAKSLAVLSIPFGIWSYGRSFQEKTFFMGFAKRIDQKTSDLQDILLRFLQKSKNFNDTSSSRMLRSSREEKQQCMERIACEGLFKSLPQIFLKSVFNGQDYRNLKIFGSFENPPENSKMSTEGVTSRRKNLAQFAMSRIKNREKLFPNGHKTPESYSEPENPCLIYKCALMT